jgi:hypothetical protein
MFTLCGACDADIDAALKSFLAHVYWFNVEFISASRKKRPEFLNPGLSQITLYSNDICFRVFPLGLLIFSIVNFSTPPVYPAFIFSFVSAGRFELPKHRVAKSG